MVAVMGILNLCVLFVSIYAESSASKWREEVARLTHVTEQMRTMLSATEAMPRVDERARALGLVRPQMVAYLPMPAPVAPHGRPLPPAVGVGPGY
jgi:transposase